MRAFKYEIGATVRDVITGVEGTITSQCRHATGCDRYFIQPEGDGKKAADGAWSDETALTRTGTNEAVVRVAAGQTRDNGPLADPPKRGAR